MPFIGCANSDEKTADDVIEGKPYLNLASNVDFVGDAACFDCHEDEYRGFREHGMSRSMYSLTQETAVEAFGSEVVVDTLTGLHYETQADDSGYYMTEYLLDSTGNRVHELRRPMQYVVGSGISARTYLAERDGWFYELPVSWYTQQKKWDFSPGYRVANKRFDRKITDRCVVCHNSYPEPVSQTEGMFDSMPEGIGCERCHGPGALHVQERLTSFEVSGMADYTIVNPAHLSLDRRLDVCQQCHLSSSVSILRDGKTAYDFRPSDDLSDYIALFQAHENINTNEIGVISHADRMQLSACFASTQQLDDALECTTCHDPHGGFREQGPDYFNTTCIDCHAEGRLDFINAATNSETHTLAANCVACHMPKTDLIEAPHSAFTDHWIRVVKNDEMPPEVVHEPDLLTAHFKRDRSGTQDARSYEGMAYITRGYQEGEDKLIRKGLQLLQSEFDEGHVLSEAMYLHGFGHVALGQYEEALVSLEESVRLQPDRAERMNTLAQAYEGAGRDPVVIERLYRQALRIQPKLSDVRINYGRFLETTGRGEEAIEEYREVIQTESWNALGYYNLGTALLRQGELAEAEKYLRKSLELDPFHGETLSNLGLAKIQAGELEDAETILELAVGRNPEHAASLENLGTLYLNTERGLLAIEFLMRSIESDPFSADATAKLGLAKFRVEDYAGARESAEKALQLDPSHALAAQILQAL